jgi:hypothetical protein
MFNDVKAEIKLGVEAEGRAGIRLTARIAWRRVESTDNISVSSVSVSG